MNKVGGEDVLGDIFAEQFEHMVASDFMGKPQIVRQWFDTITKCLAERNRFDSEQEGDFNAKEQAELFEYITQNIGEFLTANPEVFLQVLSSHKNLFQEAAALLGYEVMPKDDDSLVEAT